MRKSKLPSCINKSIILNMGEIADTVLHLDGVSKGGGHYLSVT